MSVIIDGTNGVITPGLEADSPTLVVDKVNDRVGIGTSSPSSPLTVGDGTAPAGTTILGSLISTDTAAGFVAGIRKSADTGAVPLAFLKSRGTAASPTIVANNDNTATMQGFGFDGTNYIANAAIRFAVDGTPGTGSMPGRIEFTTASAGTLFERMRIDSNGNLMVNTTSTEGGHRFSAANAGAASMVLRRNTNDGSVANFMRGTSFVGSISVTSSATSYNTSSDYRLKENVEPMTGALEKVQALNPVTWSWKSSGEAGQGFIAHELAEVCPDAVTGEKDAVDEEGNPQYQGVDTSFLVGILTKAIQELNAKVESLQAQLEAK